MDEPARAEQGGEFDDDAPSAGEHRHYGREQAQCAEPGRYLVGGTQPLWCPAAELGDERDLGDDRPGDQ
jgi:hypothetical protein